ncbi:MAG: diaminopimelate epimerase [Eggerthellaceae bacterium]|nr:diaminopimelate epimerase [Eggerthellaceae bacterium]
MRNDYDFVKLHGAGNDFVFIEDLNNQIDLTPEEIARICDRHFGVGADGVIFVRPPEDPCNSGFMDYRNADGSIAQMCGNGVRCFAKYLVDYGIVEKNTPLLNVETRAGVKVISYSTTDEGKLLTATVDMGAPILSPHLVPTTLAFNAMTELGEAFVKESPIESPYGTFDFTCISMGNPHAVTFVDDCESIDIDCIGAYFESCDAFPEKANIEFATVKDDGIHMRVYERGCGETLACGTGACATGVAAFLTGRTGAENDLILLGGTLHIAYTPGGSVLMTGPAEESFTGTFSL